MRGGVQTLATGAANQTYAKQLTDIASTFNALSDDDKKRCILVSGADVYQLQHYLLGDFYLFFQNEAHIVFGLFMSIANKKRFSGAVNGTLADDSASLNTRALLLQIKK